MKEEKNKRSYLIYAGLGIDLFVSTIVGAVIGYFIDKNMDSFPVFFLIFLVLGAASGFWTIYKRLQKG